MKKFVRISAILLVASVLSCVAENNGTKPVIFLTSPPTSAPNNVSSDNGNSESRLNEKIASDGQKGTGQKQVVSSQGYQLEVIDDNTEEEAQERSGSENPRHQLGGLYSQAVVDQTASLLDQFLHPDYDDNSAKEDDKDQFAIPKGKLAYGDIQPKSDLSKVRDIFVGKEVGGGKSHFPNPHATTYTSSAPEESKYKLEYESPVKYVSPPIILKQASLPLLEPSPVAAPHHGLRDADVTGHIAGYGHGYHRYQQKLKSKPLKPSVVYRDPSDSFDHHDKIRTLDKDHLGGIEKDSRHPYGPHVIAKGHQNFHDYHHEKKVVFEPSHYDQSKITECAHKNKYIYNLTFCLDDPHYPVETIIYALKESGHYAKKLLSDVTYQSADNLVTGLTRAEEEGYTYKHYFGATHAQNVHLDKYKPPYQGYTYSTDYFKKGGYICPSDIYYARPKRAMNTFGKWKVIVNVDHVPEHGHDNYDQGHHHEGGHYNKGHGISHGHEQEHEGPYGKDHGPGPYGKDHGPGPYGKDHGPYGKHHDHDDRNEHKHQQDPHYHGHNDEHNHHNTYNGADSYGQHSIKKREYKEHKKSYTQTLRLEQCIYPNAPCSYVDSHYHSRCIQKHNFVRLVAWTHDEGIHVDTFKMPIACSCHVRQPIHFYHESGRHEHKEGHIVPHVNSYHGHNHGHHQHHTESHGLKKVY